MTIIIPDGYCQCLIRLDDPSFTDGYALITEGMTLAGFGSLEGAAIAVATYLQTWDGLAAISTQTNVATVTCLTASEVATAIVDELGTNAQEFGPVNTSVLVRKITSFRGPRGRGRSYWPNFLAEPDVTNSGYMTAGTRDTYNDWFADYNTLGVPGDRPWVLLQGDDGMSPPHDPPPTIVRREVDQQVATQRRRLRR